MASAAQTPAITRADLNRQERAAYDNAKSPAIAAAFLARIANDRAAMLEDARKWGRMPSPYGRITGDEHTRDYYASCGAVAGRL